MTVLSIETDSRRKGKRRVRLDNGTDLVLYEKELRQFSIEEGTALSDAAYAVLLREVFFPRAKRRALYLLQKQDRTEDNLRRKLQENGYPPEAVDAAIAYVSSYRYIDDLRYARNYVRCHQGVKSRRRVEQELLKRGVKRDVIAQAMEEYTASEPELIDRILHKRRYDPETADRKETERHFRYLMGQGFSCDDIRSVLYREGSS